MAGAHGTGAAWSATKWMKLAKLGLTTEEVIARGAINSAAQASKSAPEADLKTPTSGLERDLPSIEATIADSKAAYYAALTKRQQLLRALSRSD